MAEHLHVYSLPPIDWWSGAMTVEAYLHSVVEAYSAIEEHNAHGASGIARAAQEVEDLYSAATNAARERSYWEGDITEGPYVLVLPSGDQPNTELAGFMWKQCNNGSVFVVSRFPLVHLAEYEESGAS